VDKKLRFIVFCIFVILVLIASQLQFIGCAGSSKLTPEEQQAVRDSLNRVARFEISKLWSIAWEAYKVEDYSKAVKYFNKVIKSDTLGVYGHNKFVYISDSFVKLNNPDSAEWALREGLKEFPDKPYFYETLGYIYRSRNQNEEAINMYKKLIELEPNEIKHYDALADLYVNINDTEDAMKTLQKMLDIDPENTGARQKLTALLNQSGDINALIVEQKKMVELQPDNMSNRLELARTYYRDTQYENTAAQLEVVAAQEPENVFALELLGDTYQKLDKYNEAVTVYNRILKVNPKDIKNMCNLAGCYTALGRYTQALRQTSQALRIDPNYGLAFLTKGLVYEAAAEKCVDKRGGEIKYDDRLVYQMAYDQFLLAKKDFSWKQDAERHLAYLQDLIPSKQLKFMHKGQTMPEDECYRWIQ